MWSIWHIPAERFGAAFGSGDFARMTALAHDLGKYSSAFQRRLRGTTAA